jgi:Uma2 family endonuclease
VAVEVSSPSTRKIDAVRKRDLYERFGVPEYWLVDLDAERVEIHRLEGGAYHKPLLLGRGDVLQSPVLLGLSLPIDELLGPPEED